MQNIVKDVKRFIEDHVYEELGRKLIKIPNSRLDFSGEFVFEGFTKTGQVKLAQIIGSGPDGLKTRRVFGKIDGNYLSVLADNYLLGLDGSDGCPKCGSKEFGYHTIKRQDPTLTDDEFTLWICKNCAYQPTENHIPGLV